MGRWRAGANRLALIESLALTPQASLHVVRAGSQMLLVGAGPVSIRELVDRVEAGVADVELAVESDDHPRGSGAGL
ncbi:MAG: flagellar biosynthetic protein FliO [Candidatus Tyrphobacter sp.]